MQESEIAGAQEGAVERVRRLLRPVPVAGGDARSGDADLADPPRRDRLATLRIGGIGDDDLLPSPGMAAAHELPAIRRPVRPPRLAVIQPCRRETVHHRQPQPSAGHEKRRLGEAIARIERRAAETAGRERRR
ncbi:MAG TPA: hypothetical protein VGK45_16675, partial [Thermoanaerobaculia bacterium]